MGPSRKRQRISEDGAAAPAAAAETTQEPAANDASAAQSETVKAEPQNAPRRQLFIRSLPATVTNDDLTEHFSQSFPIKHAVVVTDKETKLCKGYGFVTFADAEDAARAKEEFNGSEIQGRKMRVDIAEPRQRDTEHKTSTPAKASIEAKQKREDAKALATQSKLIIRNLPWSIKTPEQLSVLFRSYGKVKYAVIPKKGSGMLAGYGFVTLRGRKNAEKALEGINGKEVDGRTLAVDWAVEKEAWEKAQDDEDEEEKEDANAQAEDAGSEAASEGEGASDDEGASEDDDDENEDDEDEDDDDEDEDEDDEDDMDVDEPAPHRPSSANSTLFIRNLPFTCDDESLHDHFEQFGAVRYARIVMDHATERPRGTGFVCFYNDEDAINCLKGAPKHQAPRNPQDRSAPLAAHSVLQNEDSDATGQYTMDGRVLHVTMAVNKSEAEKLTAEGVAFRGNRDKDKRKLYLLQEGSIATNSPMYQLLAPAEISMREASAKQRKQLVESNPSLHLSLTRLSVRNLPRSITSKDLKQLAREAVVGFAKDVKEGKRQRLSREELERGSEEMAEAEKERKAKGKGVVRQAKIVFEGREGGKIEEKSGAGRSRGYGFIEYYTHRSALMGLRWLNGHALGYQAVEGKKGKKPTPEDIQDRKKRLIVEFALENAQVVQRRKEKEVKMREKPKADADGEARDGKRQGSQKRKRGQDEGDEAKSKDEKSSAAKDEKLAKQSRIIARKRQLRRARNKGTRA
ncbi:uncharacterized protein K452DRAFT_267824 [Aplosporella prunicola CBS 121167]|uniref:RRM domain-containing protein n=1 Tax=Aplosporella prunicola CBS 121167 TaxID=1176127 RepID=A0A6A6BHI3_9PEZI|nr:uncharacterized protein K452DRAFT_267824 [Aplosporella prunicola CBS 121167]KAF2143609.1 hypothetical protein K452DRAFT_267824 [Aplosporella prunicola CBS 121167]